MSTGDTAVPNDTRLPLPSWARGVPVADPEHPGIQEQLLRLHGSYDRLIGAAEQTADTVIITDRLSTQPPGTRA